MAKGLHGAGASPCHVVTLDQARPPARRRLLQVFSPGPISTPPGSRHFSSTRTPQCRICHSRGSRRALSPHISRLWQNSDTRFQASPEIWRKCLTPRYSLFRSFFILNDSSVLSCALISINFSRSILHDSSELILRTQNIFDALAFTFTNGATNEHFSSRRYN